MSNTRSGGGGRSAIDLPPPQQRSQESCATDRHKAPRAVRLADQEHDSLPIDRPAIAHGERQQRIICTDRLTLDAVDLDDEEAFALRERVGRCEAQLEATIVK